ncbi:hypothetical protein G9A89_006050 [Geosiphon pyriformis]|nr:hypothetical protein G9A89_006050 [Geosiphon pyriformis]
MTTTSLSSFEECLEEWERLCFRFYSKNDELAGIVINLVEFSTHAKDQVMINWSVFDSQNPQTLKVDELLVKIGFLNGIMRFPQKYEAYIVAKRKVRVDWHQKKARDLNRELDRLLHSKPAQYTRPHRISALKTFLAQYKSSLGGGPFIKGLFCALNLQIDQNNLVSWTFLDDTFTQNEADFMRASVNLLTNVLGLTHTVQEADESGEQASLRTWYMNSALDDAEIRSLIKLFPKRNSIVNVRATGTIQLSSQTRPLEMVSRRYKVITNLCRLPIKVALLLYFVLRSWANHGIEVFSWRKKYGESQTSA